MAAQLMGETPDAYHVMTPDGNVTPIVKAGLSDDTHAMIQSLPRGGDAAPPAAIAAPVAAPVPATPVGTPPPMLATATPAVASAAPPVVQNADMRIQGNEPVPQEAAPQAQPQGPAPVAPIGQRIRESNDRAMYDYGVVAQRKAAGMAQEARAVNQMVKAQTKLNQATVQGLQEQGQVTADYNAKLAEHQAQTQTAIDAATQRIQDAQAKVATMKVDPNAFWNDSSAATKIGAALAMGMTAFGNALTHTSGNAAMDIINKTVDDYAQGKMNERRAAQENVAAMQGERAELKNTRQQSFEDLIANKNMALEAVKLKAQQYIAAANDDLTRANGAKLIGELTQKQADNTAQLVDHVNQNEARNFQLELQDQNQRQDYMGKMASAQAKAAENDLSLPGLKGQAKTKEAYMKAADIEVAYQKVIPMINQLRKLREENGVDLMRGENAAVAQSLATSIQLALKDAKGLGVLSGSDLDLLRKIQPDDPTMIGHVLARLDTLEDQIHNETKASLRTYGFSQRDPKYDPRFPIEGFVPDGGSEDRPTPKSKREALQADTDSALRASNTAQAGSSDYAPALYVPGQGG